ncbi:MAG: MFS transporter [Rhodothermaceae bacterium]|nr:MFS transporter [Rhodothermaceae bacterium]
MALFPMAIITIFWQDELGFSMTQIFAIKAVFAATLGILELPSGFIADRIGYRKTLLIATGIMVGGWSIYLVADTFSIILCAEIVLGMGLSLMSGTDSAMLYESLLREDKAHRFAVWQGRVRFFGQLAEGSTALVAGLLYAISPRLPFVLQVALYVGGLFIVLSLVEPTTHRVVVTEPLKRMKNILFGILNGSSRLRAVVFLTVILGITTYIPVWIIQVYAEEGGVPVEWLGPLWAAANYTVAIAALNSARMSAGIGLLPSLLLCVVLAGFGYIGLGLVTAWWGFVFYFCITAIRGIGITLMEHEEQKLIPSSDRASFISARKLLFNSVFIVVGPIVGLLIDRLGNHAALLITSVILLPALCIGWFWLRNELGKAGPVTPSAV